MPAKDIETLRSLREALQHRAASLSEEDPSYLGTMENLTRANRLMSNYEQSQRKTDDAGKLTAEPKTIEPSSTGQLNPKGFDYHFEPSVAEVQQMLRSDPALAKNLGIDPDWISGIAEPERAEPVVDPTSGAVVGQTVEPAKTHLDVLKPGESAYIDVAEHVWKQRRAEAEAAGKSLQRYKNVHYKSQPRDFLAGGLEYNIDRRLAPAAIGAANALSLRQAGPLLDATSDALEYESNRPDSKLGGEDDVSDPMTGQHIGTAPHVAGTPTVIPKAQDVINRSPGFALAGEVAAYGLRLNPTNVAQEVARGLSQRVLSKLAGRVGENAVADAVIPGAAGALAGAAANTVENAYGAFSDELSRANISPDGSLFTLSDLKKPAEAALNSMPVNAAAGALGGLSGEALGQGFHGGSDFLRNRIPDIDTVRTGGGDTRAVRGVKPPPEVDALEQEARRKLNRGEESIGSPARIVANQVAPDIERSLADQAAAENKKIGEQMEEYYNHPAYGSREVNALPAVQGLVDLAGVGWSKDPLKPGSLVNVDQPQIRRIGEVLKRVARPLPVPRSQTSGIANQLGGAVISGELANHLFGLEGNDAIQRGHDMVLAPLKLDARTLTHLEQTIDDELNKASKRGSENDPVWNRLNQGVKKMRDEFPLYRDEDGNLVAPPAEQRASSPFDLSEDLPPDPNVDVLDKPKAIEPSQTRSLEAEPGVGPGQPDLPSNPFESRVGKVAQGPAEALPRPIDIQGEEQLNRPEGLLGVGPGQPDLPSNPFDPRLPVSRERLNPQGAVDVRGDYAEPEVIGPEALPGPGPRRDGRIPARQQPITPDEAPVTLGGEPYRPDVIDREALPGIGPRRDRSQFDAELLRAPETVHGGEFAEPGIIEQAVEGKPPSTLRMGAANRNADETPLSLLAGNKLAMDVPAGTHDGLTEPPGVYQPDPYDSMPMPTAKENALADRESAEWFEDIVSEGRDIRSDESKRLGDLTRQQEAFEQAQAQVRNMEERLGPLSDDSRLKSILGVLSKTLGREVTKEDLIRAGIISAGGVAMVASDDEDVQGGGAAAMVLGGGGSRMGRRSAPPGGPTSILEDIERAAPRKPPTQPEVKLANGETVRGFSALRHQQHEGKSAIERAKTRVGAGGEVTLEKRVLNYNQDKNALEQDKALKAEAERIGKSKELRVAAAAGAYNRLKGKGLADAAGAVGKGNWNWLINAAGVRADRVLDVLSGADANKFAKDPGGFERWLRESLNLRGGRPGARYGDIDAIHKALFGTDTKFEKTKEDKKEEQ